MTRPIAVRRTLPVLAICALGCLFFAAPALASKPLVMINQAAGQGDPATTSPIEFTASFSSSVTGFSGADVSFAGSTAGGTLVAEVSGSGSTYTVSVSGMTTTGVVKPSIPANAAQNSAGETSLASTSIDNEVTWQVVSHRPTDTIDQAAGQADPTATSPIEFTASFSSAVTGFSGADVSISGSTAGGTLSVDVSGSGSTYTVSVSGMTTTGFVKAEIPENAAQNSAGEESLASTSTDNEVTWHDGPAVTLERAAGQPDPASGSPIRLRAVFSAPVTGFSAADVDLSASTAGGTLTAQVSGGPKEYEISVSGMTTSGSVVASIVENAATDSSDRTSVASGQVSVAWSAATAGPPAAGVGAGTLKLLSKCRNAHPCATSGGGKKLRLSFSCEGGGACAEDVAITYRGVRKHGKRPKPVVLARVRVTLAAGSSGSVAVPLGRRARALLAASPRLKASLAIGPKATTSPLVIKAGKK